LSAAATMATVRIVRGSSSRMPNGILRSKRQRKRSGQADGQPMPVSISPAAGTASRPVAPRHGRSFRLLHIPITPVGGHDR
jgi:hypothetical protein